MKCLGFYSTFKLINKPVAVSWMLAKKHKILKSEIKDFISHGTVGSMSFMFASISHDPQIPQDDTGEPTWMLA